MEQNKNENVGWNVTHEKIEKKITNRVKGNQIQNCVLGWLSAQGWKLRKTTTTEKSSNE